MRLGQLMKNVFADIESDGLDPFYLEDNELLRRIEEFVARNNWSEKEQTI